MILVGDHLVHKMLLRTIKLVKTGLSASFFLKIPHNQAMFLLPVFFFIGLVGCANPPEELVYSGEVMGTTYQVKIVTADKLLPRNTRKLIDDQLQKINKIFTTYNKKSELMLFNDSLINQPQTVSPEMIYVLSIAQDIFVLSDGYFDPTVSSLVDLWGFGPQKSKDVVPSRELIDNLLPFIGFDKLAIDKKKYLATRLGDIKIDLSAIAKGYAADTVAELLNSLGAKNYLIEVGGELRIQGERLDGKSWRIAIEKPSFMQDGVQQVIQIKDSGVATSGDYRNYFEKNGKRYSHTIDPRTGYPITHKLASATVIAKNAAEADALATVMMVLGPEKALVLAEDNSIPAYFLVKRLDSFDVVYSSAFSPYLLGE